MYEENEKKIDWIIIIKRIITLVVVLLVIFGIITLVTKCSKDNNKNQNNFVENVDLTNLLDEMQIATLNYINKDNLPTELNGTKTIKLKYLINKNLIGEIKDSNNNVCNQNTSYSEITKLENNYAVKISLTCGQNADYRIIYIGCFDNCLNGGICTGDENTTGGICNVVAEKEENKNNSTNTTTKNPTIANTPNKPSTTIKPSTNTTKPTVKTTLYEYQKCTHTPYCAESGYRLEGSVCVKEVQETKTINATNTGVNTTYTCPSGYNLYNNTQCRKPVTSKKTVFATYVTFKNTSSAVNKSGSNTKYTYVGITDSGYAYYKCSNGVIPYKSGSTYVCGTTNTTTYETINATKSTSNTEYKCSDTSYKYNGNTGKCEKVVTVTKETTPTYKNACVTTWSSSPSLSGWIKTGVTKTE